ncbi:MAG: hypothetical protein HY319_29360 [Armatimonadetes bacterium]|nr:hypothetical protein [Armatimonadota bacterium]
MSIPKPELTPVQPGPAGGTRLVLPDCPGCDTPLSVEGLSLHEETRCPHCKVVLLLVRIDGVLMFLRDGWT